MRQDTRKTKKRSTPRLSAPSQRDMQLRSELWLGFYQQYIDGLLVRDEENNAAPEFVPGKAADLADKSLTVFEERWPGVKLRNVE